MRWLGLDDHLGELRRRRVCSTSVLQAPGLGCVDESTNLVRLGACAAASSLDGYALDTTCLIG